MSNLEQKKQWEERVNAFKASGLSTAKWSEINNIKVTQLRYWLRKFKSEQSAKSSTQWVSIAMEEQPNIDNSTITVRIGQIAIEVKPGYNEQLLTDVIRTLQPLC